MSTSTSFATPQSHSSLHNQIMTESHRKTEIVVSVQSALAEEEEAMMEDDKDGVGEYEGLLEADSEVKGVLNEMAKLTPHDEKSRCYQAALLEIAKERNLIICLPTGSGKTYIALQLTKHYLYDAIRDSRYIVFLATTVPLVRQQAAYFRNHIYNTLSQDQNGMAHFTGDMNVKHWTREKWIAEIHNQNILVMTDQIFLDILRCGYISFRQVLLLILDECHHAGKDHPMSKVMTSYRKYCASDETTTRPLPRVLGLTATIIRGIGNIPNIETEVAEVENIMCAKAITYHDYEEVLKHSTNAKLEYVTYSSEAADFHLAEANWLLSPLKKCILALESFDVIEVKRNGIPSGGHSFAKKLNPTKDICKVLDDVINVYEELGLYCSRLAACMKTAYLETNVKHEPELIRNHRLVAKTALILFTVRAERLLGNEDKSVQIHRVSNKLKALMELILNFEDNDGVRLCAVAFVQRRLMTQILAFFFQDLAKYGGYRYKFIRAAFVVGSTTLNGVDLEEARVSAAKQLEVVQRFHEGKYNLVFATSVLEEGLDVPSCNLVMRFDEINSYPSYVQSMGRARKRDARFCVFTEITKAEKQSVFCDRFKRYNEALSDYLRENAYHVDDGEEANIFLEPDILPPLCPGGTVDSPIVTMADAIPIVYQYCNLLAVDRFVASNPVSWWVTVPQPEGLPHFKAFIRFPHNSVVRNVVEGPTMRSITLAKRAVYLNACKELYKHGGLNKHLLPARAILPEIVSTFLESINRKQGNSEYQHRNYSWYEKLVPNFVRDRVIEPGQLFDTFVVHMTSNTTLTDSIYNFDKKSYRYGLIVPQNIGAFTEFELEGRVGFKVRFEKVSLNVHDQCGFNSDHLATMKSFHAFLFERLLFLKLNYAHCGDTSSLFVVPLVKGKFDEGYRIEWDVMKKAILFDDSVLQIRPTTTELEAWRAEDNYDELILVPWYRPDVKMYIVQSIAKLNLDSEMTEGKERKSYRAYYLDKYGLSVRNENQPLLTCSLAPLPMNFLSAKQSYSNSKVEKQNYIENNVVLIPELTRIYQFPSSLHVQARLIPSVLHRVFRLMISEELKLEIAKHFDWKPAMEQVAPVVTAEFEEGEILESFNSPTKRRRIQPIGPTPPFGVETHVSNGNTVKSTSRRDLKVEDNNMLEYIHPDELTWSDIERIKTLKRNQRKGQNSSSNVFNVSDRLCQLNLDDINDYQDTVTNLDRSADFTTECGPSSQVLMESLTVSNAFDSVSLERLETMGDSFLKYVVSVQTYCDFPSADEGLLTQLRSKLICNKYLFNLGTVKKIGERLSGGIFNPLYTWLPPGYHVPDGICKIASDFDLTPDAFANIPLVELEAMSKEDRTKLVKSAGDCSKGAPNNTTYEYTRLTNKTIADAVEALIGAYFTNGGSGCALRFMEWLGMRSPTTNGPKNFGTWKIPVPDRNLHNQDRTVRNFLPLIDHLEKIIQYKFNDPWLLVEAFTHSSYTSNSVTGCYQRLEFLGDAVLDFLVTCHIFHMPRSGGKPPLTPGELTDLRSALVNNVTFGSLAVRYGLDKYLLCMSKDLQDSINFFAGCQDRQNHEVSSHFSLLPVIGKPIAQDVEVPKVLGDLFESLAGAIYLDCEMSLDTTWKIFYRLLKHEIDLFSENVPISPIRELYEMNPNVEIKSLAGVLKEKVPNYNGSLVRIKFGDETFYGVGKNKACARNAAAKLALKMINKK